MEGRHVWFSSRVFFLEKSPFQAIQRVRTATPDNYDDLRASWMCEQWPVEKEKRLLFTVLFLGLDLFKESKSKWMFR